MADFQANIWPIQSTRKLADTAQGRFMRFSAFGSEPGGGGDATAPQVTNQSPSPGTAISRTALVTFDVTDDVAIRDVFVAVRFQNGDYEVAWDGTRFASRYASSSRAAIGGGHRFTLQRTGGWPSSPTFRVVAVDTSGNEDA